MLAKQRAWYWLLGATLSVIYMCGLESQARGQPTMVSLRLQKGERVVFLGDSITQDGITETGFQTLLGAHLRAKHSDLAIKLINAGISGDKVTDLQSRLAKDVLERKPTIVVIHIGVNDVWRGKDGTPKDRYEAGIRDIVARITKTGASVVLCTPSVIGERKNGANSYDKQLDEYAAICRKVSRDLNVPVVDFRKLFIKCLAKNNLDDDAENILTKDGVHLNDAGNRFVAEQLAHAFGVGPLSIIQSSERKGMPSEARPSGPRWIFRDGDRLYWSGSSHSQDEGWQCSVMEFYLRTRFPQWKISSGRGGPTDVSASATADVIQRLKPTVIFCEFGYYGTDDNVLGVVKGAEQLLKVCREKKVNLVMMPSAFRAAHINRLPAEYKGLINQQIAELNERKRKEGTLGKLGQEIPVEVRETHWRMRGAPGCDKRVAAMQEWGAKVAVQVPRSYQDQREWLFKIWETDPKFPWGGGHPPVAGYVAVGYFLLERMEAPIPESRLVFDVAGEKPTVRQSVQCSVSEIVKTEGGLRFKRLDKVLPVVPPLPLERLPREPCPVLKYSPYFLTVTGLPAGKYEITVEKILLGRATHEELAAGVNLNAVYMKSAFKDSSAKGVSLLPWSRAWTICRDKNLDKDPMFGPQEAVGKATWLWELRQMKSPQ